MTDDTLSGDSGYYGGGVTNWGTATLADDTFADNNGYYGGGGRPRQLLGGTTTISDSILDSASCSGTITDGGHNVETGDSCGFGTTSLNTSTTINLAATLVANTSTGPQTLAIGPTSSAFEEVPATRARRAPRAR